MAITYTGKLFESALVTDPKTHTLGISADAGSLIIIAFGGKRSGASLDLTSVTDSNGNTYTRYTRPSSTAFAGIAYTRTATAMNTSDTLIVNWNGTPTKAWASAHAFVGASGTRTDADSASGYNSTIVVPVTVSGSDWLTFCTTTFQDDYSMTLTGANSTTSRDNNAVSSEPWCECGSRNGTVGTSHTIGFTAVATVRWVIVAVSFPFLAAPAGGGGARVFGGLIGV